MNTPLVPFASGNSSSSSTNVMSTVVTYDTNGVRMLDPTNSAFFAQPFSSLVPHANNRLAGSYGLSGTTTVTSLVCTSSSTISNSGTVQVASGVVVAGGSLDFSQNAVLAFGPTTGYLHLGNTLTFNTGTGITGTGGVVVTSGNNSGLTFTTFANANSFTGGLFVNGNAKVTFASDGQLGASGQPITLNGGTLINSSGATMNRPINLGPGGGTLTTSGGPLTVAGSMTRTGGLTIPTNFYPVTIAGTNFYSGATTAIGTATLAGSNSGGGPTIIQGSLSFSSGLNFSSGPIILAGGSINALASGTFARDLTTAASTATFSVAAGQSVTYTGNLSGGATLTLSGGGTLAFATANLGIAGLSVAGVTAVLTGPTSLPKTAVVVSTGGVVRLDDTAGTGSRLGPNSPVSLSAGGELRLDGGTGPTAETIGALTSNGTVTIVPGTGTTAGVTAASLYVSPLDSPPALFRGTNLGGTAAESAHLNVTGLATSTVILNALADTSATGTGQDQAVYGVGGIRPVVVSDFTSGPVLQNGSPTNTPFTANFRVSGSVTTAGASNTIRSLRMEPGGTLTIPSGTLSLGGGGFIYMAPGGTATIAGPGTIQTLFGVLAMGDLNLSATLSNETLSKYGPGTLTVSGPASFSQLNVRAGTIVLNSGQAVPVSFAAVTSNPGQSHHYTAGKSSPQAGGQNLLEIIVVPTGLFALRRSAAFRGSLLL